MHACMYYLALTWRFTMIHYHILYATASTYKISSMDKVKPRKIFTNNLLFIFIYFYTYCFILNLGSNTKCEGIIPYSKISYLFHIS